MKKHLPKSKSAPDSLPRLETRHKIIQKTSKGSWRRHSDSTINRETQRQSWLSVNNISFQNHAPVTFRSAPTPFPFVRSSTFDKRSLRQYAPPLFTIIQSECETYQGETLKADDQMIGCPSNASTESIDMLSPSEHDYRSHKNTRVCPRTCYRRKVLARSRSQSDSGKLDVFTLKQQLERRSVRTPRTPAASPEAGDRGHAPTPKGEDPCASGDTGEDSRDTDETRPSPVTCPVLTQEVLSAQLQGRAIPNNDRVNDWLASCDHNIRSLTIPPHLPDINRLKRHNTSMA